MPRLALKTFLGALDPFTQRYVLGCSLTTTDIPRYLSLSDDDRHSLNEQVATYWRLAVAVPEQMRRERRRRRQQAELVLALHGNLRSRPRRGAPSKTRGQMKVAALVPEIGTAAERLSPAFEVIARLRTKQGGADRDAIAEALQDQYPADEIAAIVHSRTAHAAAVRLVSRRHGQPYRSVQTELARWRRREPRAAPA
jgi:hypothetical protein